MAPLIGGGITGTGSQTVGAAPGTTPTNQTYYSSQQTGNQDQTGTVGNVQANQYNAGQTALQNMLPSAYQSILQGQNVPSYFTAPQAAFDAYNNNFQNYVEPGIAAQFGAGSPQIGSQQSLGNMNLAAQLYQNGQQNYLGYLNSAAANAFTPIGANALTNTNMNWQNQDATSGYQGDSVYGSILSKLMAGLTGAIP